MIVYLFEKSIFCRVTCYEISKSNCGKSNKCIVEAIQICPLVFYLIKYRCIKETLLLLDGKMEYQYKYWSFLNWQSRQSYLLTRWNQKKDHHSRNQKGDNVHDFEQKLNYLAICIVHIWSFFSEPFKLLEMIKRILWCHQWVHFLLYMYQYLNPMLTFCPKKLAKDAIKIPLIGTPRREYNMQTILPSSVRGNICP